MRISPSSRRARIPRASASSVSPIRRAGRSYTSTRQACIAKRAINRSLNRAVHAAIADADLAVQVISAGQWDDEDTAVYAALADRAIPRLLAINKVDRIADKTKLLPFVEDVTRDRTWGEVFLISAEKRSGLAELERAILAR